MPHIERLERLEAYLLTVPPQQFNMTIWGTVQHPKVGDCETAACGLGWATTIFEELKMVPTEVESSSGLIDAWIVQYVRQTMDPDRPILLTGYCAASAFFDLPEYQARHIFDPDRYIVPAMPQYLKEVEYRAHKAITPDRVAARIREVIRDAQDTEAMLDRVERAATS